jgi:enoyl-CoA hydratase/carnithine racemase
MTSATPLLAAENADGVQTWRMQGAPANALNPSMLEALDQQLNLASTDESISIIVLTSGLKIFSAGADASWMADRYTARGVDGLVEEFKSTMDYFREVATSMKRSPLLFIAALNGHTLAGGLELASACDFRFASNSERLQIGVPEMDLFGAVPSGGGGAQFLSRILGPTKALRFILDAKSISPQRALEIGLIDQLFEPADLLAQTQSYAAGIAKKAGRVGVAAAKRIVMGGAELPLYDALEYGAAVHWDAMRRGNFKAGVADFMARFGSKT